MSISATTDLPATEFYQKMQDEYLPQIQQLKGANKAVMIQHGSYITVYNNLTNILVKKGDKVATKQQIGTIYKNPSSGKTVLKFLVYKNTSRMNPADWVYKM